jgi:chromosome segregation ATPase
MAQRVLLENEVARLRAKLKEVEEEREEFRNYNSRAQDDLKRLKQEMEKLKIDKAMIVHEFTALQETVKWWKELVYKNLRVVS